MATSEIEPRICRISITNGLTEAYNNIGGIEMKMEQVKPSETPSMDHLSGPGADAMAIRAWQKGVQALTLILSLIVTSFLPVTEHISSCAESAHQ